MIRNLFAAGLLGGCLVLSDAVLASPGVTVDLARMHAGPGSGRVIAVIPAGAPIEVFECSNWCRIGFGGTYGFVAAHQISGGYTEPARRDYYAAPGYPWSPEQPPPLVLPPGAFPGERALEYPAHYRRGDGAYFEFGY